MPIYEFHCEKCGKDSEILIRSSDVKGTKCPECGSTKLEKKFFSCLLQKIKIGEHCLLSIVFKDENDLF